LSGDSIRTSLHWLEAGGMMIFDDDQWQKEAPPERGPQLGVDSFLRLIEGRYRELEKDYQLAVEKL
jgi:hypothetical protein